ncbi:hypothetical protein [Deinococcus pimensis]|uniref:hypothetical protein n=1 Tax=Deinococcus pimensis TaxID=309888 RepID=UPI00047F9A7F|nr:hypothetical protein [Deinococcus pimensis]
MRSRSLAFRVASIWLVLAGLTLLFPGVGNVVFDLHLRNWGLASEYGGALVAFGVMYWVFAGDAERYAPIMPIIAAGGLLNVLINAYWWAVGEYTMQSAIFNVVLNSALAVWFWTLRPRGAGSARTSSV